MRVVKIGVGAVVALAAVVIDALVWWSTIDPVLSVLQSKGAAGKFFSSLLGSHVAMLALAIAAIYYVYRAFTEAEPPAQTALPISYTTKVENRLENNPLFQFNPTFAPVVGTPPQTDSARRADAYLSLLKERQRLEDDLQPLREIEEAGIRVTPLLKVGKDQGDYRAEKIARIRRDIADIDRQLTGQGENILSKAPPIVSESEAKEPEPTLISLMNTNFPQMNKFWGKPVLKFADRSSLEVTSVLYFDMFTSGAKFLGFHIPHSAHVVEACAVLADHAVELGDALSKGGLSITSKAPGENPQTIADLKYSGKVYLYHEDHLTYKQMADAEDIFKAAELNVVFRGPDFLTHAWIAWKEKSDLEM